MGEILTPLGFADRKLKNNGAVLILSRKAREQAHVLQRLHCIPSCITEAQATACPQCAQKNPSMAAKAQPAKSKCRKA